MSNDMERERFEAWFASAYTDTLELLEKHRMSSVSDLMLAAWQAARATPIEPQWISVEERLPEPGQSVALVSIDRWENAGDLERNVHAAGYLNAAAGPMSYWSVRGERALTLEAFTHWMPLPAAPSAPSDQQGGRG